MKNVKKNVRNNLLEKARTTARIPIPRWIRIQTRMQIQTQIQTQTQILQTRWPIEDQIHEEIQ
jgi:hypothetical protein